MDPVRRSLCVAALGAVTWSLAPRSGWGAADGGGPRIAAASDLGVVLGEIAAAWRRAGGGPLRLSFGSSGTFATQIRSGAPFALYLSADEAYVQQLQEAGLTQGGGTLYALGRLALVAPPGGALPLDVDLAGVVASLRAGRLRRFAIANPAHAPYGRRAEEVLRRAGLWEAIRPHLVLGENVSQAAQFATGGSADGGLVALSLLQAPALRGRVRYVAIPADRHSPLRQRMVLLKGADAAAVAFYRFLQEPVARGLLRAHGFSLPDGTD
jgi:molybdate transport system substrate-binding protein